MEAISMSILLQTFGAFGPFGVVVVIWYFDMKCMRKILARYKEDVDEIRAMYEKNVSLVKDYNSLAKDLKDVIILNTQQITRLSDKMRGIND